MIRRAVWIGGITVGAILLSTALLLATLNGTFSRDPSTILSVVMVGTYVAVGALLASRVPQNPIGWLFLVVGIGVLLGGAASEYAVYALRTHPGKLPLGTAAAWITNWAFTPATLVPVILILFPTGRVPSRGWRWAPGAIVGCSVALALLSMFRDGQIDVTSELIVRNPAGISALSPVFDVIIWPIALALLGLSLLSAVPLVQRFRAAAADERQQLRWLAAIGTLTAIALVVTVSTSIGIPQGGSTTINDLSFSVFFVCVGIGIPLACTVAILKYRLYDLDLVVRKTVVITVMVVVLTGLYLGIVALATVGRVSRLAIGAILLVVTFNPVRRAARSLADRVVHGRRASSYEVLSEFTARVAESYAADDVLPRMATVLAQATGATSSQVWLRVGNRWRPAASWPGGMATSAPLPADDDRLPDALGPDAFEVRHRGELLGALTLEMPANDPMDPSKARTVRDLASQAGLVLRNVRLVEDLKASRQRLVAAQDEERRRLERNIHDGAQQQLVAMSVRQRLLNTMIGQDDERARAMVEELQRETNDTLETLRDLARGIYPPLLADRGLPAALEAQARKAAVPTSVRADGIGRFGPDVEAAVYFCVLEALNNVAKYAQATSVMLSLQRTDGSLTFAVTDDGRGFDPTTVSGGTGLQGMADRLDAIGGKLTVRSAPGHGTAIEGAVPAVPEGGS